MNAKILVCIPCHNRREIVDWCLPTVFQGMRSGDVLSLWNDGSTEYDDAWLRKYGNEVRRAKTASGGVISDAIGIERQRREHFLDFWNRQQNFTHLYLTDSDAMHDPHWRTEALWLQQKYNQAPLCLYNTDAHVRLLGNTIEDNPNNEVIWRRVAPGISYFLTHEHVRTVVRALPHLPEHWHWDWTVPGLLGHFFAVSRKSYLDHLGWKGMHHPENEGIDGGDRALNPTSWLVKWRARAVEEIKNAAQPSHQC